MNFYKNIEPLLEYFFSLRKLKDYLSFDLIIPAKWTLPKTIEEIEVVPFKVEDPNFKGISFVCPVSEQHVSKLIIMINKVIKLNKERELKEILFKQTIEELKKTFEKNDLDTLQKLYFDFGKEQEESVNLNDYEEGQSDDPTLELAE